MIPTRRAFLFGAAATIVAPLLPVADALAPPLIVPEPVVWPYGRRSIFDIFMAYCGEPLEKDVCMDVRVICERGPGEAWQFLYLGMHPRSMLRWVAPPGGEIIIPADHRLRLDVNPALDDMKIQLASQDERGEKFFEEYVWKNDKIISSAVNLQAPPTEQDEEDDEEEQDA